MALVSAASEFPPERPRRDSLRPIASGLTSGAILTAMRPRQWVKNLLVLVAPLAAGRLGVPSSLEHAGTALLAFTLAAPALYLFNDVRDSPRDRVHPTKRLRPIASGQVAPRRALWLAGLLALGAVVATGLDGSNWALLATVIAYLVNGVSYCLWLRHKPVIELGSVASGFFLRAFAGAEAEHLAVSTWFYVVISAGALFLVIGKRLAEHHHLAGATTHRPALAAYSNTYLSSALTLTSSVAVTGYFLWAFGAGKSSPVVVSHVPVAVRLTAVPVVLATLYVLLRLEGRDGGAPEELVFKDRTVQVLGGLWAVLIAIGIYA